MDATAARSIARWSHSGQVDRLGEPVAEHVERVAAAVPADARTVAFLHDVLEHTPTRVEELRSRGLTPLELAALELLTCGATESFELHALRIAHAGGPEGALARKVKLAELDDHLARHDSPDGSPPYAWARCHISHAEERSGTRGLAA